MKIAATGGEPRGSESVMAAVGDSGREPSPLLLDGFKDRREKKSIVHDIAAYMLSIYQCCVVGVGVNSATAQMYSKSIL